MPLRKIPRPKLATLSALPQWASATAEIYLYSSHIDLVPFFIAQPYHIVPFISILPFASVQFVLVCAYSTCFVCSNRIRLSCP
jgi:hypothetical protein